ncbi:hypothetical protein AB0E82_15215 [Streptomyces anulatus]|uniref:hypothetical protein n=1 Tax=Streptomyces TaxID=1883 RepID=UPI00093AC30D|nr:hypothetical protein [Streptomyces sp. CB02115]OKJ51677.1 hypothetical protein AMK28_25090 [Streptomyces sp. CB02115]
MGIGLLLLVFAVVWLVIGLVRRPSPSAQKAWARGVTGISVLLILGAVLYGATVETSSDYDGPSPALLALLVVAIAVAPGVIAALVRSGRNS